MVWLVLSNSLIENMSLYTLFSFVRKKKLILFIFSLHKWFLKKQKNKKQNKTKNGTWNKKRQYRSNVVWVLVNLKCKISYCLIWELVLNSAYAKIIWYFNMMISNNYYWINIIYSNLFLSFFYGKKKKYLLDLGRRIW